MKIIHFSVNRKGESEKRETPKEADEKGRAVFIVFMIALITLIAAALSACVTPIRHRVEVAEARVNVLNQALRYAGQVQNDEITISDFIWDLKAERAKELNRLSFLRSNYKDNP